MIFRKYFSHLECLWWLKMLVHQNCFPVDHKIKALIAKIGLCFHFLPHLKLINRTSTPHCKPPNHHINIPCLWPPTTIATAKVTHPHRQPSYVISLCQLLVFHSIFKNTTKHSKIFSFLKNTFTWNYFMEGKYFLSNQTQQYFFFVFLVHVWIVKIAHLDTLVPFHV